MFKLLKRLLSKELKPVNAHNENNGAVIDMRFIPTPDKLIFVKSAGPITIAVVMLVNKEQISDLIIHRMESWDPDCTVVDVLRSPVTCHLGYSSAANPVPPCRFIRKEPRTILFDGHTLKIKNYASDIDVNNPFADLEKLKQFFWNLTIPFMGPSTLLTPLQENYVKTLYDIAQSGRIQQQHAPEIVQFLERYSYIQMNGGNVTITNRAGKVFKTAMAANDIRTASLRLTQCVDFDVWPYCF